MSFADEVWYGTKDRSEIARLKAVENECHYQSELLKIKREELELHKKEFEFEQKKQR